jgi:carbon monoxide dehydrogenase subunit G
MKIANEFTVHVPIDVAWKALTDLEGIAPCLPGAQLTGVDGDVYRGKVKVKVGPVISEFAGTARFAEKDDGAYRGVIDAKGRDARSAGNATALITAQLRADGGSTVVNVDTDLKISGKLAQFGSGMIREVSQKLLGQFVTSLEAKIAADNGTAPAEPKAPAPAEAQAPAPAEAQAPAPAEAQAPAPPEAAEVPAPAETAEAPAPAETAEAPAPAETAEAPTPVAATIMPAIPEAGPGGATPALDTDGTATDAEAGADVAAVRDVAGDEAPLDAAAGRDRPSTPLGSAPSAAVGDAVTVPKKGFAATPEPEPLDLLEFAGGSIRKRVVPVAIGVVVVVAAIVVWRIVK